MRWEGDGGGGAWYKEKQYLNQVNTDPESTSEVLFCHAWLHLLEYSPLRLCTHSIHTLYRCTLPWLYLRPRRRGGRECRSERNHISPWNFNQVNADPESTSEVLFCHAWLNLLEYSPLNLCTHFIHTIHACTPSHFYRRLISWVLSHKLFYSSKYSSSIVIDYFLTSSIFSLADLYEFILEWETFILETCSSEGFSLLHLSL